MTCCLGFHKETQVAQAFSAPLLPLPRRQHFPFSRLELRGGEAAEAAAGAPQLGRSAHPTGHLPSWLWAGLVRSSGGAGGLPLWRKGQDRGSGMPQRKPALLPWGGWQGRETAPSSAVCSQLCEGRFTKCHVMLATTSPRWVWIRIPMLRGRHDTERAGSMSPPQGGRWPRQYLDLLCLRWEWVLET